MPQLCILKLTSLQSHAHVDSDSDQGEPHIDRDNVPRARELCMTACVCHRVRFVAPMSR